MHLMDNPTPAGRTKKSTGQHWDYRQRVVISLSKFNASMMQADQAGKGRAANRTDRLALVIKRVLPAA